MKFSIITLMTLTTLFCWCLALYQIPTEYRVNLVAGTFLSIPVIMLLIALSSGTNDEGSLDCDKNLLFEAFEPTFKIAAWIIVLFVIGFPVLLLFLFLYS